MAKTAWINLTENKIEIKETPSELLEKFIGSRGMAAKTLYDNVGVDVDPYSSENLLIFSMGPFTGTPWPSGARYTVTAKSPATGAYGYANSSGYFGPELKHAGYDMLVFKGISEEPVYLQIEDDQIRLLPAGDLWGKNCFEVENTLKARHEKSKVACIGTAGENLVKFAAIINDHGRAAARTGMGAVMGSKKLKAVIVRSTKKQSYSKEFIDVVKRVTPIIKNHPGSIEYTKWGTVILLNYKNNSGDNPAKNHQFGQFLVNGNITAQSIAKYTVRNTGCYACSIKCSRVTEVKSGQFMTPEGEGPEFETANALGANIWNSDPELLIHCNKICNDIGIDTISAGVCIAFAMELKEKGLLNDDFYSLGWGNPETIIGLLNDIALRRGIGNLLADGVKSASEEIGNGSESFAMQVKGVEMPRQEGRVWKAFGLAHATSNRGADHLYALPTIDGTGNKVIADRYLSECGPELMDMHNEKYKGIMCRFTEACNGLADCLGICKFAFTETFAIGPEDLAEGLNALMGYKHTEKSMLEAGKRLVNLERMYNVRHGMSRKEDTLPRRSLEEPLYVFENPEEAGFVDIKDAKIAKVLNLNLPIMLDEYYEAGKWTEDGIPTSERLCELGLEDIVKDLPKGHI